MQISDIMPRRYTVSVVGNADVLPGSERYILAYDLGKALVDNGYRVVCGGLRGIMEAASKGASESKEHGDGDIIGILPGTDPANSNSYLDICLPTGLDLGRNILVASSDAVIAVGGGSGTLSEMANAWALRRLIIGYRVEGWSGKLADTRIDERIRYPDIPEDRVFGVDNEKEVLDLLAEYLPRYNLRSTGIRY